MEFVICHKDNNLEGEEADDLDEDSHLSGVMRSRSNTNWMKAAIGLGFLQQGLAPFVDREVFNKHSSFLNKVSFQGPRRCSCTFKNILPDHDISLCTLQKCLCKEKTKRRRKCPNNLCSTFCQLILNEHKTDDPLWKNSDINAWPTDHWSIAKCYMTTQTPSSSAQETDASGLLSVIINGKFFQPKVHSKLGQTGDVFLKARDFRNDIFHRAKMELTDAELQDMLDTCIAVLKDPVSLLQDPDACSAVKQLESLRNDRLKLTTDEETRILYQRTEALKQTIQEALESIGAQQNIAVDDLKRLGEETIKQVLETGSRAVENNAAAFQRQVDELLERLRKTEEMIQFCKNAETNVGGAILDTKKDMSKQLPVIRRKLADHLRKHYTKTSLSPLKTRENDVNIDDVYIEADMEIEQKTIEPGSEKGKQTERLKQYRDIFELKRIYVLGEFGTGKTTFCQLLINKWCNFIIEDSEDDSELMQIMKTFDFVFYLPLRCLQPIENLKEMIERYYKNEVSKEMVGYILSEVPEKCLILADGLDEWKPSTEIKRPVHVSYGIPDAEDIKRVTLVTTSRPSALGVLNMKSTEYDKKIILYGIKKDKINTMAERYCAKLSAADKNGVLERLKDLPVKNIENMPLILKHIVWMLGKGYEIAPGISGLYSDLVKIAMKWAHDKYQHENNNFEVCCRVPELKLPGQLSRTPFIEECRNLLISLSQIAYEMLTTDSNQTFGRFKLRTNGIVDTDIKSLLKVGLLSEENFDNPMEEDTQFYFPHQSFIEYFCAVYIASHQTPTRGDKHHADSVNLLDRLFEKCRSTKDVLPMKLMLEFVCGLAPDLTQFVCQNICRIAQSCNSLSKVRESHEGHTHFVETFIRDKSKVQFLIAACVTECRMANSSVTLQVPVVDLLVHEESYLDIQQHIEGQSVRNLYVYDPNSEAHGSSVFAVYCAQYKHLQSIVYYTRNLCRQPFPPTFSKKRQNILQLAENSDILRQEMLVMERPVIPGILQGDLQEIEWNAIKLFLLSEAAVVQTYFYRTNSLGNNSSLEMLVMEGQVIPDVLKNLQEIELNDITLFSHSEVRLITTFISHTITLRDIRLIEVMSLKCKKDCNHFLDLSQHDKLQTLRLTGSVKINVTDINNSYLEEIELDQNRLLDVGKLTNSQKLKYLHFGREKRLTAIIVARSYVSKYPFNKEMNVAICTCTQLQHITLDDFHIHDGALQLHSSMVNLSQIRLYVITMSEFTFIKFVESLLTLRQSVNVEILWTSTKDNKRCIKYVRNNTEKFRNVIIRDDGLFFETLK